MSMSYFYFLENNTYLGFTDVLLSCLGTKEDWIVIELMQALLMIVNRKIVSSEH